MIGSDWPVCTVAAEIASGGRRSSAGPLTNAREANRIQSSAGPPGGSGAAEVDASSVNDTLHGATDAERDLRRSANRDGESCAVRCLALQQGGNQTGSSSSTLTIAMIPKGTTHTFWQSIHAGANRAAKELGIELIWRGPLREDDRDSQVSEIEGFISRGVSGHCHRAARRGSAGRTGERCDEQEDPRGDL